jgi:hypothetical protein
MVTKHARADRLVLRAENERLRQLVRDMREVILLDPGALTYGMKRRDVLERTAPHDPESPDDIGHESSDD